MNTSRALLLTACGLTFAATDIRAEPVKGELILDFDTNYDAETLTIDNPFGDPLTLTIQRNIMNAQGSVNDFGDVYIQGETTEYSGNGSSLVQNNLGYLAFSPSNDRRPDPDMLFLGDVASTVDGQVSSPRSIFVYDGDAAAAYVRSEVFRESGPSVIRIEAFKDLTSGSPTFSILPDVPGDTTQYPEGRPDRFEVIYSNPDADLFVVGRGGRPTDFGTDVLYETSSLNGGDVRRVAGSGDTFTFNGKSFEIDNFVAQGVNEEGVIAIKATLTNGRQANLLRNPATGELFPVTVQGEPLNSIPGGTDLGAGRVFDSFADGTTSFQGFASTDDDPFRTYQYIGNYRTGEVQLVYEAPADDPNFFFGEGQFLDFEGSFLDDPIEEFPPVYQGVYLQSVRAFLDYDPFASDNEETAFLVQLTPDTGEQSVFLSDEDFDFAGTPFDKVTLFFNPAGHSSGAVLGFAQVASGDGSQTGDLFYIANAQGEVFLQLMTGDQVELADGSMLTINSFDSLGFDLRAVTAYGSHFSTDGLSAINDDGLLATTLNGDGLYVLDLSDAIAAAAIPEPASLALLAIGLGGLGLRRRRRPVHAPTFH